MTHKNISKACREWIASVLRGEGCAALPATEKVVVATAMDEGVAALLLDALADSPLASRDAVVALMPSLASVVRDQVAVEMLRKAEITRVTNALLGAAFPLLVLKGAALAYRVYERPYQRPRCDLDLLFPAVTFVASAQPLLGCLGYEGSRPQIDLLIANEASFRRRAPGGTVQWIDAHWALTNNALFGARFSYEELEQESVALPGFADEVRGLGDVHALIHACLHRVANMQSGLEDRLIWLYDVLLLAKRLSSVDWERVIDLAVERRVAGPVLSGLEAAAHWLGTAIPEKALVALRHAAASESFDVRRAKHRGYMEWSSFCALPLGLRGRWLWQNLFPDSAYIEAWNRKRGRTGSTAHYWRWRRLLNITRLFGT